MFCLLPSLCFAQKVYEGQVIDKATEDPISNVNITLIKEKIGIQTNERGYFELSSEHPVPNDTLQFSSVGYKTFKLPVSAYQSQMFVVLEASNTRLNEVRIANKKKLKNIVLDKFAYYDLKSVDGVSYGHSTEIIKARTALAKFFTAPNANAVVTKISLGRQDLLTSPTYSVRNKLTTFLIHIMTPDTLTGAPGKVIFTKTVSLNDNSLWVDIDLTNDKRIIPTKNFFVAVEWIITPYNEIIGVNNAPKVAKTTKRGYQVIKDASEYYVYYQPFLVGYSPEDDTRKRALLYTRNNDKWQIFRHQKSELALSATIHY
ncbi:hypothetical protein GCM10022392_02460 [Mucilaginibacter panaciglaebae]|uniref:Carboxypeptidase-like protein n=2 Tax=Mucilaginibacter panaciglaebae TaxID=502331 RepID=A0ABP7WCF0_9SPHI